MSRTRLERRVRVLVADDSMVMQGVFRALFADGMFAKEGMPAMELCGMAQDGVECLEAVKRLKPDVLVLDMEMPQMHGLEVLERLRTEAPELPAIMCSSYTERGARATLDGLMRGAADYVTKPAMQDDIQMGLRTLAEQLLPKVAALAGRTFFEPKDEDGEGTAAGMMPLRARAAARVEVVAIGVSTGGPSALEKMLPQLPRDFPAAVLIVQHMPKLFTHALAERLDRCCVLRVREAFDGAEVMSGTVWLAPGDVHMEVEAAADGIGTVVRLRAGEPMNHYKPAVDCLFASVAKRYGAAGLALVMTGMGCDGLKGAKAVRDAGGAVLVQDEASSTVWGMPGRVAKAGLALAEVPLGGLAKELMRRVAERQGETGMRLVKTRESGGAGVAVEASE